MKNSSVVEKPWGSFREFSKNKESTVKILYVSDGEEFSLQSHAHRKEFWFVLKGTPKIIAGDKEILAHPNDEFYITKGEKHRITALNGDVEVLEVSFGEFDENDITRFEDKYGRT